MVNKKVIHAIAVVRSKIESHMPTILRLIELEITLEQCWMTIREGEAKQHERT